MPGDAIFLRTRLTESRPRGLLAVQPDAKIDGLCGHRDKNLKRGYY